MSAQDRGWGPGYPDCQRDKIVTLIVEGVSFPGGVRREVLPLFRAFLAEFHQKVEKLVDGWCWGFACRPIRGSTNPSNHSWGLAVDVNAPSHPLGMQGTFSANQAKQCRILAAKYGLRWGGDYSGRKDEMHFEFMGTPSDAAAIIRNLDGHQEEDVLKRDDSGNEVRAMQDDLFLFLKRHDRYDAEAHGEPDGHFGAKTEAAVKAAQKLIGYRQTGVYDLSLDRRVTPFARHIDIQRASDGRYARVNHTHDDSADHTHDFAAKTHYHDFETTTKGATGKARP